MHEEGLMKFCVFVIAFFCCVFIGVNSTSAKSGIADQDSGKKPHNCVICSGDEKTYLMEKQFADRIKIIKSILGNAVDEIALAATVLHKEDSLEAVKSRYDENFKSDEYRKNMKILFDSQKGDENEATSSETLGVNNGVSGEQIDLLNAAAIIMADSSGWTGQYNEAKYQEALARDGLITSNSFVNEIFCIAGANADATFTAGNIIYKFATGQDVQAEINRTSSRWYNMDKICKNGYVGGVYDLTPETKPDEEIRKLQREEIAEEIINLIHYYKLLVDKQECFDYDSVGVSGHTTIADLAGKSIEERIEILGPAAQAVYAKSGAFASVTLAQAIAETGIGTATCGDSTADSNNVLCVRCGRPGKSCSGGWTKFDSIEESFADRPDMFDGFSGYGNWRGANTPQEQIAELAGAYCPGCATYVSDTMSIIKTYNLTKYDVRNGSVSGEDSSVCPEDTYSCGTTEEMQKVVNEAKRRAGGGYDGNCQGWVEQVWSAALGKTATNKNSAYEAWLDFKVSSEKKNIPPGAMVYTTGWPYCSKDKTECYETENPYGHVGIYLGNDEVADQNGVHNLDSWINQQNAVSHGKIGWLGWGWQNDEDLSGGKGGTCKAEAVAQCAKEQIGKPYVWGAAGPGSFDCSGLVTYCYKKALGVTVGHYTGIQYADPQFTTVSSADELGPGDIILDGGSSPSHVGIYMGDGRVIHAPTFGDHVREVSLAEFQGWVGGSETYRRFKG